MAAGFYGIHFLAIGISLFCAPTANIAIRVTVGYLGARNSFPNAEKVLQATKQYLIDTGVIDSSLQIELRSQLACYAESEGAGATFAARMVVNESVKAFIGPHCSSDTDLVGKMAAFWNVPVLGYMAVSSFLTNKSLYATLSRVSMTTTNGASDAFVAIFKYYNWNRIAIVCNDLDFSNRRVSAFEEAASKNGIKITIKVVFLANATAQEMVASGQLNKIKGRARVVLAIFGETLDKTVAFMKAISDSGMRSAEYQYVLPWLVHDTIDDPPWITNDNLTNPQIKQLYDNSLISLMYGYLQLSDALKLYVLTLRRALNYTGDENIVNNGRYLWNLMRSFSFQGVSGNVTLDDAADRIQLFSTYYVMPERDNMVKVASMRPFRPSFCDGGFNTSGCDTLIVTSTNTTFIYQPIPEEPKCGFTGEKCDITTEILIGCGCLVFVVALILSVAFYNKYKKEQLRRMPWRIMSDDVKFIAQNQNLITASYMSINTKRSAETQAGHIKRAMVGNNLAAVQVFVQHKAISLTRAELSQLYQMKQISNDNLNTFLGMSFNEKNQLYILWKYCSRGSLLDVLHNEEIHIDATFHGAFVRDILKGLDYLHSSPIGSHGCLSSSTCLIDQNWLVKLTGFCVEEYLVRWTKQNMISFNPMDGVCKPPGADIIYTAPELLREQDKYTIAQKQAGDVYAFGVVLYEILLRETPFDQRELAANNSTVQAEQSGKPVRPTMASSTNLNHELVTLLKACWSEQSVERPSVKQIRKITDVVLKIRGGLVDQMMSMMDQYSKNLEKLVKERTAMLEETQQRADNLLFQLLPAYVATELKFGRSVPPKSFSSGTVLFTDIVGFTSLCSTSTPLQIVTFLNGLFSGFDEVIMKHDAYKVETIGDAYMVVSGVPQENGTNHLEQIAYVTLYMRHFLSMYEIPHRRNQRLRCRWGFHTGPLAAGVVGSTAPRYCLFGDTVNVASRMESTGLPGMIQISETTQKLLTKLYSAFTCTLRGSIDIKGKGKCVTYWLESHAMLPAVSGQSENEPSSYLQSDTELPVNQE
uniref:Guanylate cyclase n=1 Tax=Plectus sambesii TaxID=2011161 RepID=A0A914WA68_9BILA